MIRTIFSALASLMLIASPAVAAPEVGKPAPDFMLKDVSGKDVKLSDYKGKYVVLEWHNPECPFVIKHYGSNNMQRLQASTKEIQAVWLTINSSAAGKQGHMNGNQASEYLKKSKALPNHYLFDADGTVGRLYEAKTTPHMFVINKDGNIAYMGAIDDKPSADKADVATATNYVNDALTALHAGKPVAKSSTQPYGCNVKYAD
ncbi:MAG: thioredoxin family protein [Alphaproteobacteria bacterium]